MVRIDIQCLCTIEEEILEGLRPIQVPLIVFPIMDQGRGGHAACEVFRCVIHTLGGQNDMNDIGIVVAKVMTNIIAFSLEGLWRYILPMSIPSLKVGAGRLL